MATIDPEKLREIREKSLLKRWAEGKLNSRHPEFQEIAHLLPESARNAAPAPVADSAPSLNPREFYRYPLSHYAPIFKTGVRAIKDWIAAGKAGDPPKLPPLDDPEKMSDWWTSYMTQRCPDKILRFELESKQPAATHSNESESIDISTLNIEEGVAMRQANQILAACAHKLTLAFASGNDTQILLWQRRWEKALDARAKARASDRAEKKAAGEIIPKSELFLDLGHYLETQRIMRSTMARKVIEALGELPDGLAEKIEAEIEKHRRAEESVLRRLKHYRNANEIELELSAA